MAALTTMNTQTETEFALQWTGAVLGNPDLEFENEAQEFETAILEEEAANL